MQQNSNSSKRQKKKKPPLTTTKYQGFNMFQQTRDLKNTSMLNRNQVHLGFIQNASQI